PPVLHYDVHGGMPGAHILGINRMDAVGMVSDAWSHAGRTRPGECSAIGDSKVIGDFKASGKFQIIGDFKAIGNFKADRDSGNIGLSTRSSARITGMTHSTSSRKRAALASPPALPPPLAALLAALAAVVPALLVLLAAQPVLSQQPAAAPVRQERGSLILEGIPARDTELADRLARYRQSRQATFLDWLPEGGMLIGTRFGDVEQIHRVTAPLGLREQLTFYPDPVSVARAPRTGPGFVFLKDQGGNENAQVYYYSANGHVQALTEGKGMHGDPLWSNDGRHVAFFGTERDGVSYDIYVADIGSSAAPRLVTSGQQDTWFPLDWSPDDRKLLLLKYVSINESYLYVADVYINTLTPLDDSGHKVGIQSARFAPDGRGVYFTTDEDGEFSQLRYLDPVSHEVRRLTANIPWDVEDFDVSADGRYVACVVNDDGHSRLTVLDTVQKLDLAPAGLPDGRIENVRFDRTGRRLALSAESPQSPRDVYVYDLEHNSLERWTRSEVGPVDSTAFVPAELVRYPTWDRVNGGQRMIPAFLYRPRSPGPHPVLIDIHGGPESQSRAGWNPFVQFLVNELGYAVIAPNVRGSSGYGKSFLRLDNGMLREDAVKDIGSLIVWIGVQPSFDRNRIAVMGGSYGGYMALASLAAYGDRLRGGVDEVGISNFVTFLENTSPYRRDQRRQEYGDERDPKMRAFLNRISPLSNVASIRKPLLVVAGMNDPRVPLTESEQLVWRMRGKGSEVWYLAARDEGHGFRKKANQDALLETVAMFLSRLAKN
ncbi:MAG TPA: S9 family peptidase, partial [Steroidobacteraceae bacterium]|nr:S9 family peptidase [Steroidobacteraceae bacterium]